MRRISLFLLVGCGTLSLLNLSRASNCEGTSFLQGWKNTLSPIKRRTQEERAKGGAIGKNYIYGDDRNRIATDYFYNPERNEVVGSVLFNNECEGPPGFAHGGATAAVLDDVMSQAASKYFQHKYPHNPNLPPSRTSNRDNEYRFPKAYSSLCTPKNICKGGEERREKDFRAG